MSQPQPNATTLQEIWWQLLDVFKRKLRELAHNKYKVIIFIIIVGPIIYYLGKMIMAKVRSASSTTTHMLESSSNGHQNGHSSHCEPNCGHINVNTKQGNENINDKGAQIDISAITANIESKHNKQINGTAQENEHIDYAAIVANIESKQSLQQQQLEQKKNEEDLQFDEAYAQFLTETGQIDEIDEHGAVVGLIQEDDMNDQCGMERVTLSDFLQKKINNGELLMILNEDENAWEPWNLMQVDDKTISLRINGGDTERHIWLDDLENHMIYRMIDTSQMYSEDHHLESDFDDDENESKENALGNGHSKSNGHSSHCKPNCGHSKSESKADDNEHNSHCKPDCSHDASGFQKEFDYSNCMIKDEHNKLWRVSEHYDKETAKGTIVNVGTGESKQVFLNKMVHTLPFQ